MHQLSARRLKFVGAFAKKIYLDHEVYIWISPWFGIISHIVSIFQKKKHVFNYLGMVCALINIGDFGLIVWAHHMCTVSLSLNLH